MTVLKIIFAVIMFEEFLSTVYYLDKQEVGGFPKFGALLFSFGKVLIFTIILTSGTFF